ncbi:MAG: ribosome hibernation-promoting factor, HPF/YfiA family [Chloroflexota bacterium]
MQLLIKGKNVELTDSMRAVVEKKLGRLERYADSVRQTDVEVTQEKTKAASDRYTVQVTMIANGAILRAEERAQDVSAAVDAVVEVMQRRLTHFKGKLQRRGRGVPLRETMAEESSAGEAAEAENVEDEEEGARVVRTKRIAIKPMSVEEAADQMELLGHDFFLFLNSSSDTIGVLYRRRGGDYGLIESELHS